MRKAGCRWRLIRCARNAVDRQLSRDERAGSGCKLVAAHSFVVCPSLATKEGWLSLVIATCASCDLHIVEATEAFATLSYVGVRQDATFCAPVFPLQSLSVCGRLVTLR